MLAKRSTILALSVAAGVALLSGCAGAPDAASTASHSATATMTPPSPTPSDTASPTPRGTASATPTTAPSATPEATLSPSASAPATTDCPVGTWELDQAGLDGFYADVNAQLAGSGLSFTPQGRAGLVLTADGRYTWSPDLAMTADTAGTPIDITITGESSGAYTVAGGRLSAGPAATDTLAITATIGGAPADAGEITHELAQPPIADAAFSCAGSTLTIDAAVAGGTASATLHRQ